MFKKSLLKKEISTLIGVLVIVVFAAPLATWAIGTVSTGYRINAQTSVGQKITAYDYCRNVTNSHAANDYFVPTRTSSEFDAVLSNAPAGLDFSQYPVTVRLTALWTGSIVATQNVVIPVGTVFNIGFRSTYNGGFANFSGGVIHSSTFKDDFYQYGYFFNSNAANMSSVAIKGYYAPALTTGFDYTYTQTGDLTNSVQMKMRVEVIDGCVTIPINGACGLAGGNQYPDADAVNLSGLCSVSGLAFPTAVSGTGPWSWTCAGSGGGTTASCSATVGVGSPGVCGPVNATVQTSLDATSTGLCSSGALSGFTGNALSGWSWACVGSSGFDFCFADSVFGGEGGEKGECGEAICI